MVAGRDSVWLYGHNVLMDPPVGLHSTGTCELSDPKRGLSFPDRH